MRKFRRRNAKRGEMIVMALTAVLVLGALTVTGVYIKNRNDALKQDGYYIDFDALEAELNNKINQDQNDNDLDYTGTQEEFDFSAQNAEAVQSGSVKKEDDGKKDETIVENQVLEEEPLEEVVTVPKETTPVTGTTVTNIPTLSFSEDETLIWPIMGNVLINFSMDKTVYFATLDQYKYNPAMILSATKGEQVTAAKEAVITCVYKDNELGNVVEMDLGNGYTLTYGQLTDVIVCAGQYVTSGQLIARAADPTKYYSVEGCNLYVKLTKDGEPVDPMNYFE